MTSGASGALRLLRRLLWGAAVVCLGAWGWAHLDAARWEAAAERRLERALAGGDSSAAGVEARAIERAVEAELRRQGTTGAPPDAPDVAAGVPAGRPPSLPAPTVATVDETEILGRLVMPRIGLEAVIAEGVDRRTLRRAAGRIPGTAPLGGDGNAGVAGHRDGVFRELSHAAAGDLVLVETPSGTHRYRVEAVSIVGEEGTHVLDPTTRPTLTLVTCYPFDVLGPAPERWVVRAREIGPAGRK